MIFEGKFRARQRTEFDRDFWNRWRPEGAPSYQKLVLGGRGRRPWAPQNWRKIAFFSSRKKFQKIWSLTIYRLNKPGITGKSTGWLRFLCGQILIIVTSFFLILNWKLHFFPIFFPKKHILFSPASLECRTILNFSPKDAPFNFKFDSVFKKLKLHHLLQFFWVAVLKFCQFSKNHTGAWTPPTALEIL